jgi:hypothetical protein
MRSSALFRLFVESVANMQAIFCSSWPVMSGFLPMVLGEPLWITSVATERLSATRYPYAL